MKIEDEIKQNKFISSHQKAVINLLFTSNWLVNKQHDYFKPFGITGQQFNVLRILKGQYPKSISAKEIKSRMLDKNSDISRLLDRLISKKLIEKKSCPKDKRATDVFITENGLSLLKEISSKQKDIDQVLTLTDDEAEQLSNLLDKSRGK
ncbi:MAG TPA: MarR family transcriptional regulator [Cyclobacteriaceae bacterium]|nr:MarR family transcriptional regulator [Cyclobacteriaceae bacterium]HRJ82140.1 MarR family transcriptional regulator [Cyclobacteriaceae bacterium]